MLVLGGGAYLFGYREQVTRDEQMRAAEAERAAQVEAERWRQAYRERLK